MPSRAQRTNRAHPRSARRARAPSPRALTGLRRQRRQAQLFHADVRPQARKDVVHAGARESEHISGRSQSCASALRTSLMLGKSPHCSRRARSAAGERGIPRPRTRTRRVRYAGPSTPSRRARWTAPLPLHRSANPRLRPGIPRCARRPRPLAPSGCARAACAGSSRSARPRAAPRRAANQLPEQRERRAGADHVRAREPDLLGRGILLSRVTNSASRRDLPTPRPRHQRHARAHPPGIPRSSRGEIPARARGHTQAWSCRAGCVRAGCVRSPTRASCACRGARRSARRAARRSSRRHAPVRDWPARSRGPVLEARINATARSMASPTAGARRTVRGPS